MLGQLPEASGLAISRRAPGLLWSMNDSGESTLIALATTGELRGRVRMTGATINNWEDVSVGPVPMAHASTSRISATMAETDAGNDLSSARTQARRQHNRAHRRVRLQPYPDKAHEAEAAFVAYGPDAVLITKGHPSLVFRAPREAETRGVGDVDEVAELPVDQFLTDQNRRQSRITDAETTPDGKWVVMRTNKELLLVRTRDIVAGRLATVLALRSSSLDEPQGEGVAMTDDGDVYLASEGGGHGLPGTLAHLKCALPGAGS